VGCNKALAKQAEVSEVSSVRQCARTAWADIASVVDELTTGHTTAEQVRKHAHDLGRRTEISASTPLFHIQ
jgi:hypothetical protein